MSDEHPRPAGRPGGAGRGPINGTAAAVSQGAAA